MLRITFGVSAGFLVWFIALMTGEVILSTIMPEAFGAHQKAFQEVIEKGGDFTANSSHLAMHVVIGSLATLLAGFAAALVAGEAKRTPLLLGGLLVAVGVLKMVLTWSFVPLWYHAIFTGMLAPLVILGAKLKPSSRHNAEKLQDT